MTRNRRSAELGEPDLEIAGFQLWVHGRQFPESEDADDGNWLRVTAHCGASGASVWAQGALLMVTDIARFGDACAAMLDGGLRTATLDPFEPELEVTLEAADEHGHVRARVEITPDSLLQAHRFQFEIDPSYLSGIVRQCSEIVETYPIRGQGDRRRDRQR